jgi:hypothetical protein
MTLCLSGASDVQVLEGLGLTMDQFVDLCILCGCDYCDTIRGDCSVPALTVHFWGLLPVSLLSSLCFE